MVLIDGMPDHSRIAQAPVASDFRLALNLRWPGELVEAVSPSSRGWGRKKDCRDRFKSLPAPSVQPAARLTRSEIDDR